MATLNQCVRQILCGLSDGALRSLQALIDGQVAVIQAQIVTYQTQVLQYDVLAIPVEATRAAAQLVVDNVRKSAYILPTSLISECADLGKFNLNLQQSIDATVAIADDYLFEATKLLSYRDDLNAIVNELNEIINQFTDIRNIIDQCLTS